MKKLAVWFIAIISLLCLVNCNNESVDSNTSEITTFVKQLKAGTYSNKNEVGVDVIPNFTTNDISGLLKYADDLTIIPSFPTLYKSNSGKIRLGECILWVVESIRLGFPASMGCNMVEVNADNYEAIYFLTDEEVLDAAARYKQWWDYRNLPRTTWTIDPCFDEPLCGSGYRWW